MHILGRTLVSLAEATALAALVAGSSVAAAPREETAAAASVMSCDAPAWSPDGRRVAYSCGGEVRGWHIWLIDADGRNPRRLTNGPDDSSPSWSPDGRLIAFDRLVDIDEIWTIDVGRRRERRLGMGFTPAWSPDGRRIAFSGARRGGIRVMNADGTHPRLLAEQDPDGIAWSPDGRRIAFGNCGGDGVCAIDADGRHLRRLTGRSADFGSAPTWSPDGRQIAFQAYGGAPEMDIYIMNADGSNRRRLTSDPRPDFAPAWSPDGRRIAYSRRMGVGVIFTMNPDGTHQKRLSP